MNQELLNQLPEESELVNEELKVQLRGIFEKLNRPLTLRAILEKGTDTSLEMGAFLKAIAGLSDKLSLEVELAGADSKLDEELDASLVPVVGLYCGGAYTGAAFHGVPGGQEINSFVLAVYQAAGPGQPIDEKIQKKLGKLKKQNHIKVFVSLSCHHCPNVVTAGQRLALQSPNVTCEMVDARLYPETVERYQISRVPVVVLNNSAVYVGEKDMEELLKLLR